MRVTVGHYELDVPERSSHGESPVTRDGEPTPLATIGRFKLHAHVLGGSLHDWRQHVAWTTKYQAQFVELDFNGVPGLQQAVTSSGVQRLDFAFQAPELECIEIVAWCDTPATAQELRTVESVIRTIRRATPEIILT